MDFSIFYHATAGNNPYIMDEQLARIEKSGILEQCGEFIRNVTDGQNGELPTLLKLYEYCKNNDGAVFYMHTKGAYRGGENIDDWRRLMEYFCLDRWQYCLEKMETHDVCGVNYIIAPVKHFSGNFWWARCDYIRTLISPDTPGRIVGTHPERYNVEFWIGTKEHRAFEFYNSNTNHYDARYPESKYMLV